MSVPMRVIGALATVLALAPAAASAQEPAPAPRRERGPERVIVRSENRGRIGVSLDLEADSARDKVGAEVESVTPDGPADKAGLKEGDIITRFNGTQLGGVEAADLDESGPARRLLSLARKLEPGDTVQVEYRRGQDNRKATLVAADLANNWSFRMPRMEMEAMPRAFSFAGPGEPGEGFQMFLDRGWRQLDLASLNPELGEYFGAKEGVLVLKAPGDSSGPALRGGDVITAIDGRKPTSPSHALRILRSYETGETVKLDVLRKKQKVTVSWTVPDQEQRMKRPGRPGRQERIRVETERS